MNVALFVGDAKSTPHNQKTKELKSGCSEGERREKKEKGKEYSTDKAFHQKRDPRFAVHPLLCERLGLKDK